MARTRTSGENSFFVLVMMAPLSQELESPANPARFSRYEPAGVRVTMELAAQRLAKNDDW